MPAEQGFASVQNNLGVKYYKGEGVPQDYIQAHMWSNLAAEKGDELGRKNRDIIAKSMPPGDILKAQRLAREWLEEHGG